MFISRELHSGVAHSDIISFNSLSGLFTLRGRATEPGGREGGRVWGGPSEDTLHPAAAGASRPLYPDSNANKQIIDLNASTQQTFGRRETLQI